MLISLVIYILITIAIGFSAKKEKVSSAESYFLGSRQLGSLTVALSSVASSESAWVIMGLSGSAFLYGVQTFWLVPACIIGYAFNFYILGPRIRKKSKENLAITLPEYLSKVTNNSSSVRYVAGAIVFLTMTIYVSTQLYATGKVFNTVFELEYGMGVVIGAIIVLTYTWKGGFKASAFTDVLQAFLMVLAMVIVPFFTIRQIGGFSTFIQEVMKTGDGFHSLLGNSRGWDSFALVASWTGIALAYPGLPHQLVRYMAAKDDKTIRRGGIIALIWISITLTGAILTGLSGRFLINLTDQETLIPTIIQSQVPGIFAGLLLAAILSAIYSTADSQLISASSALSLDLFRDNRKFKYKYILLLLAILTSIIAIFQASEDSLIFEVVLYAWAGLGASFGPPVILSLYWKGLTSRGVLAGMISGIIMTVLWIFFGLNSIIYEIIPAIILSTLCTIGFSLKKR